MRLSLLVLAAGFLVAVVVNCNCGAGVGAPCNQNSDCLSGVCGADNRCLAGPVGDGGEGTTDDGGSPSDGGGHLLPDGGQCQNLECQVATCPGGQTTTVTGKVYDPGGSVPLYNAIVYVPNKPLTPFTAGPSCDSCGASVSGAPVAIAITGPDGAFTLTNVPSGANIPLVVQIGKWRRQVTLPAVTACQGNPIVDANVTRLPRNQSEGDLPLMAISSGNADAFECLLRKIGISDSEFTSPGGSGRVHFYRQNGMQMQGSTPPGSELWTDAGTLMNYDVVLLPCEGSPNSKPNSAVRNVVSYTNRGGRVFATHYSYVWTRPGWPQAAVWDPGLADLYSSVFTVAVDQSFPKGQAFAQWLYNVGASPDAGWLGIRESRHDVTAVNTGSTRWLYGDVPNANPTSSIQHLTFNTPFRDAGMLPDGGPAPQCGRVVYSDFHVTAGATDGGKTLFPNDCVGGPLTTQEKALEFMLFDLSACVQDDNTGPTACGAVGQGCKGSSDCCAGLACLDGAGAPCAGGAGCSCQSMIN